LIAALVLSALGWGAEPAAVPRDDGLVQSPALVVAADPAAGYRPLVRVGAVLDDPALEEAVRSGLPLRLRFRVELWRDGFIDNLVADQTWAAVIVHEPLEKQYLVRIQQTGAEETRRVSSYESARALVEAVYRPTLRPPRPGRYYYTATLEVETLSLSDLEELERWLRGELRPAVSGKRSLPSAAGQGAKRLLLRILGLSARRHEVRSDWFVVRESPATVIE
jgi:hypothetical protein